MRLDPLPINVLVNNGIDGYLFRPHVPLLPVTSSLVATVGGTSPRFSLPLIGDRCAPPPRAYVVLGQRYVDVEREQRGDLGRQRQRDRLPLPKRPGCPLPRSGGCCDSVVPGHTRRQDECKMYSLAL